MKLKDNPALHLSARELDVWPYWTYGHHGIDGCDWCSYATDKGRSYIPPCAEEAMPLTVEQAALWHLGPNS